MLENKPSQSIMTELLGQSLYSIMIGLGFIIFPTNGIRKSIPYSFKFYSFIFPKNNHETNAISLQSLYYVWQALCSAIDEKYDMEQLWNTGGKKWTYEYKIQISKIEITKPIVLIGIIH